MEDKRMLLNLSLVIFFFFGAALGVEDDEDIEVRALTGRIQRAEEEERKDTVQKSCDGREMELSFTSLVNFGLYVIGLTIVVVANIYTAWRRRCQRQMKDHISNFVSTMKSEISYAGTAGGTDMGGAKELTVIPDVPWASNTSQTTRQSQPIDRANMHEKRDIEKVELH